MFKSKQSFTLAELGCDITKSRNVEKTYGK